MEEEKKNELLGSVRQAAQQSLEKFMLLQKYVELLELDVDRKTQLDAEHKIYEKLTGEKPWTPETNEQEDKK
jgi:hypothetical protein